MQIESCGIADVKVLIPKTFSDERGWFMETWSKARTNEALGGVEWVQENHSLSVNQHTLRGLHFQKPPFAQDKLVRVLSGAVLDVVVDIRVGSATFGQHVAVELSASNRRQLFVPRGFAHGFLTLEPDTQFAYKVSNIYAPQAEGGLLWCDPALGIDWGVDPGEVLLKEADGSFPPLSELDSPFTVQTLEVRP